MISVVIPTHKRAQVISQTLRSVLGQTYGNIEAIVVSDGPCLDTRQVVNSFSDCRLKYYEIEHSGRPAVPRNFGINKAKGGYIAFCDDDDIWMPEKLELQAARMNEDRDLGLIYTKCLLKEKQRNRVVPYLGKEGFIFEELFLSSCFIATSAVLIRTEVIKTVGMFDEDMRLKAVEDFDFWLRIARQYKIGFIDQPLAVHIENRDSLTKGILRKLTQQYLVPYRFYRNKYIGLPLFTKKILMIVGKSIVELARNRQFRENS